MQAPARKIEAVSQLPEKSQVQTLIEAEEVARWPSGLLSPERKPTLPG